MITDHIAILTHAALAEAVPNNKKPGKPLQYYALLAFPPAAGNDLADLARGVAPGGNLTGLSINVKPNSQQTKPLPGIPGDWLVVRAASQFPPYVADAHGTQLTQDADGARIRSMFYAGKKVRAALTAFAWNYDGKPGVSYNLAGVMEAGDGERLAIGSGVTASAFEKYADKSAPATGAAGNPFGGAPAADSKPALTGDNPFAQSGTGTGATNPFGG